MENWLTDIMSEFGYMGIMFLIALENIFPPIPSEVILTFGGFMTTTSKLSVIGVITSATAGSVVGAIILYMIGLQLDVAKLEKIVDRWGHVLRITKKDIHKADRWFDKYGPWTVFFCRFVPLIRSLISIPAGMSNMNVGLFLLFTTLGTLIWNIVLVNLGASLGNSWEVVVEYMGIYSKVIYVVLLLLVAILLYLFIKRRR
ncbi:DedA family protein [Virgibacillus halodenitrificans]|uniref:Alkaline phosphatase n=1 Tax=Virgibacillus halodenitrificans TaxID=1482 RepID=A0AAC9NKF0_VIRHA|nr:DedA family protein [Virgibacillus halodenitrificans]APC47604.1 alkaline phosphatase [Virgibacillus halodenitrificans]MCG1028523.1 DedA family protein [Virgibacillus halodenitrificans]CDQ32435.1 SNARE associated Golgi protein [Virgibacillus halodenitrificans]